MKKKVSNLLEVQNNKEFMSNRCKETLYDDYVIITKTIRAMEDSLKASNLTYLTANQLGLDERIIMVKYENDEIFTFINPLITDYSKELFMSREKDLFDGKEYLMPRKKIIEVTFTNKKGMLKKIIYKEGAAALLQNLIELLEGVFVSDYGLEIIPEFDEASDEEKEEVIKAYIEALNIQEKDLQEQNKDNPFMKYIDDSIKELSQQFKKEDEEIAKKEESLNRQQRRNQEKLIKKLKKLAQNNQNNQESLNNIEETQNNNEND